VQFDAVGALRGESYGDGHELFVLLGDSSLGERGLVAGSESRGHVGSERIQFGQPA
jgi:hypothetical protein